MNSFKDQKVRRNLIMDYYLNPRNKGDVSSYKNKTNHFSSQCVDQVHLGIVINNNIIADLKWDGEGCAVFISSTDIMIEIIKGKKRNEALDIINNYENMIQGKKEWNPKLLGKLAIYENVASHLNRLHCAEMVSIALRKIL